MAMPTQDLRDSIPMLDYETIAFAISEASDGNVVVSVDELKKLKSQKAVAIYKALVFSWNEFIPELINQAQLRGMDRFKYPRIYEETVGLCTLAVAVNKIMQTCGINNFTLKDLLVPKPKRTQKLLSAIVNRIQFFNTKYEVLDKAFNQAYEIKSRRIELENRKQELINQIAEMKAKKAADQKTVTLLGPELSSWRAKYEKMKDKTATKMKHLEEKAKVFKDQECVLEILEKESLYEESRVIGLQKSSLLNTSSYKERQLCDLEEDATTALKLITGLATLLKKHSATTKSLEVVKDTIGAQERTIKDLVAELQNLKMQGISKQEKLTRMHIQHQKVYSSIKEAMENEKKKISALMNGAINKSRARLIEIENEERELSEKLDARKLEFQLEMEGAANVYGEILDQLDVFHQSLSKGWEMTTEYFSDLKN